MMKQSSSSRSQRSRGWKVKHVLQVCVLVAVCVWLAYQVKHSHDKKKALEDRRSHLSDRVEGDGASFLKLGRKDPPGNTLTTTDNPTHNEGGGEEKETKEVTEHENKQDGNEEKGWGTRGNEIEEDDRERASKEAEGGEGFGEEEAKGGQSGDQGSSDNQDHGGDDGNSQEAREEHYKADDASSAVVRDTQEIDQENENVSIVNPGEQKEENIEQEELENGSSTNVTEDASKDEEVHDAAVDGEGQQYNSTSFMETAGVEREPEDASLSNSTMALKSAGHIEENINTASEADDRMEQQNNSTIFESNDRVEQQNNSTGTAPDEQEERQAASEGVNAEAVDSTPWNASINDMASAKEQNTVNEETTLSEDSSNSENNSTVSEPNNQIEQQDNISTESVPNEQVETQTNAENVESTPETATLDAGLLAQDKSVVNETATLTGDNSNTENIPLDQTKKHDLNEVADRGSNESQQTHTWSTDESGDAVHGEGSNSSSNVLSVTEEELASRTDMSTLPEVETNPLEGIAME